MTDMRKAISTLERAVELLESGWSQEMSARDARDRQCKFDSPRACKWCATASIHRAAWEANTEAPWLCFHLVSRAAVQGRPIIPSIAEWNDRPTTTQADVVTAFRDAIELAKAEG